MNVRELMSHPAVTCSTADTLARAASLMWDNDCGLLPVTDDTGKLAGVITDRDICMAACFQGKPLAELSVQGTMHQQVHTCRPEDTLAAAESVMEEHQIRRLPVVNGDGRVLGLIALNDLLREAAREARQARKAVTSNEVVHTAAAVGQPRFHRPEHAPGRGTEPVVTRRE